MDGGWFEHMPWLRLGLYLFLSTFVLGNLATYLRNRNGWPDGYSRKLNHFGHMVISTPLLAFLPPQQLIPAVILGAISVVIIYAVAAVSSKPLVHGIISGSLRRRDAPRSRFFFFFPLASGNIALVVAAICFPLEMVRVAFFTAAFADGFAEPVGLRFGRSNQYRVKDWAWGGYTTKSVAGSSAVFGWSWVIAFVAVTWSRPLDASSLLSSTLYACGVTAIEGLSPRGMDNMALLLLCPLLMLWLSWLQ